MSEYAYGLRTSTDGKTTRCCLCANPIKKGTKYVHTLDRETKVYNYCEWCWNDWAYMEELPSWDTLVNKIEEANK